MEEWRDANIPNANYQVSNYGRVRRVIGLMTKEITGSIMNCGYRYIQLTREGKRYNYLIHQLVAEAFIGKPDNYGERHGDNLVIDHIDRNKLNNRADNLRFCSHKDNLRNSDWYIQEIEEQDPIKRRNLLASRKYVLNNGGRKRNKIGMGRIFKNEWGNYRAIITVDKVKHDKTFPTREEADAFLEPFRNPKGW